MGRCRSGQSDVAVNHAALCLRGFESLPAHRSRRDSSVAERKLGKFEVMGSIPIPGS